MSAPPRTRPKRHLVRRHRPETAFLRALQVDLCKIPGVRLLRCFAGRVKVEREDGSEGWVEGMPAGTSDLLGIVGPEGWFLAIEVKAKRGTITKPQEKFLAAWLELGAITLVMKQRHVDIEESVREQHARLIAVIDQRRRQELLRPVRGAQIADAPPIG